MVGSTVWIALPLYFKGLGIGSSEIGLIMSLSGWISVLSATMIGQLVDKFGKKKFISLGLLGYSSEFFLLYLFREKRVFYFVRLIDGFFLVMFFTGIYALVAETFSNENRGGGMGVYQGFGGIGQLLGPPILISIIFTSFSYKGYFLSCGCLFFLSGLLMIATLKEYKLESETTITKNNIVKFNKMSLVKIIVLTFTYSLGGAMLLPIFSIYLTQLGFKTTDISIIFSINGLISIIIPPIFGRLSDKIGRKRVIFLGTLISSIAFLLFLSADTFNEIIITRVLQVASTMMIGPAVAAYIGDILPLGKTGLGMGLYQTTLSFDRTVGTMIGGIVSSMIGYEGIFILSSLRSFLSFIITLIYLTD
jgi:MFS family permease